MVPQLLRGHAVDPGGSPVSLHRLEGGGRVLVRPSGTEPLVRVMAEAPTQDDVDDACARIVAVVEEHLA
jgi:phosphoglucosamine mutase